MALINLTSIQPTGYTVLDDGAVPGEGENVAIGVDRLLHEGDAFFATAGSVGVIIDTETPFAKLTQIVEKIGFAIVDFPAFADGRGFSLAVRLRKDFGFKGEIRATGPVIPDQALFLLRAGFDTVETTDARKPAFEAALERFPAFYQTDFGGQLSVAHARHTQGGQITEEQRLSRKAPERQREAS